MRVAKERIRLLLKRHELLPKRGAGIHTPRPGQMWGIDSCKVRTLEDASVFVLFVVDHFNSECLALWTVYRETLNAWQTVIDHARDAYPSEPGLAVRHDHLPLFSEPSFVGMLRIRGMVSSPILPASPQGNGIAERFVRTFKENVVYRQRFATAADLQWAAEDFRQRYNAEYLLQDFGFRTPAELRRAAAGSEVTNDG